MTAVTAVLRLNSKETAGGATTLRFDCDYTDPANKAWAPWTPSAHYNMQVVNPLGEQFEEGATYLFTIRKRSETEAE